MGRCKALCGVGMTCCREKGAKRGVNEGNILSINQICTYFEDIVYDFLITIEESEY